MAVELHLAAFLILCTFTSIALSQQQQQQTNLQFYMHDRVFVPNPTGIPVAGANGSTTSIGFGTVMVIDDAITEGPSPASRALGRVQGSYIFSQLDALRLFMSFTAVFADRNGTLSFHGSDKILDPSREIAVVGGTGIYRFANGYAVLTTASISAISVVLSFNVTFQHSDEVTALSSSVPSGTRSSSRSSSPDLLSFLHIASVLALLI